MKEIVAFLSAIAAHPDDDNYRLVFADWLEDQGDWRAEFLRLDCALQSTIRTEEYSTGDYARWLELRSRLPASWLAVLGRSEIENCQVTFKFRCPQKWNKLQPTGKAAVRFCDSCHKEVYYCGTIEEAKDQAEQGHCVAVDIGVVRRPGDLFADDEDELLGMLVEE
jgi:uncharacterized protein (TIGR02996 family)